MTRQRHPALTNTSDWSARMAKPLPTRIPDDVKARFWAKVDKRGPDECWPWKGALGTHGYGSFSLNGRCMTAHRAAQFITGDSPAPGLCVDHMCRNRACVNPAHLRNVTLAVNTMENSEGIGARNARKTHCHRGHELTPENIYRKGPGGSWRECRTCAKETNAAKYARQQQQRGPSSHNSAKTHCLQGNPNDRE